MREDRYRRDILERSGSCWNDGIWVLQDSSPPIPRHTHTCRKMYMAAESQVGSRSPQLTAKVPLLPPGEPNMPEVNLRRPLGPRETTQLGLALVPWETARGGTWGQARDTCDEPRLAPGGAEARPPPGPTPGPPRPCRPHPPAPPSLREDRPLPAPGSRPPAPAPLPAQAQSRVRAAAAGVVSPPPWSVAGRARRPPPPLAASGRALCGSVSARERRQRPRWVRQVSAAAGGRGPERGAPPPSAPARPPPASGPGGAAAAGAGAGAVEGAARGGSAGCPGPVSALSAWAIGLRALGGGVWGDLVAPGQPAAPWAAGGRRAAAPSPGTGALHINCAVPRARGREPEPGGLPGGGRARSGAEGRGREGDEDGVPEQVGSRSQHRAPRGRAVDGAVGVGPGVVSCPSLRKRRVRHRAEA